MRNGLALEGVSESMDPRERKNKTTGAREDEGAEKRTTYFLQGVHRRHSWGGKGWQAGSQEGQQPQKEVSGQSLGSQGATSNSAVTDFLVPSSFMQRCTQVKKNGFISYKNALVSTKFHYIFLEKMILRDFYPLSFCSKGTDYI